MRDQQFMDCANRGLTQSETARECGCSASLVSLWATKNGVKFSESWKYKAVNRMNAKRKLDSWTNGLSKQQIRDVKTLVEAGGYSRKEACEMVTAPKVKIRLGVPA